MTRYLLDTNHAGALLKDDSTLWRRIESAEEAQFSLCRPSVGELWFMVLNSGRLAENRAKLESLLISLDTFEYDAAAAMEYGRIRVELARNGRPVPAIDAMIAAIARSNDLTVLSSDGHFQVISNLRLENWLAT